MLRKQIMEEWKIFKTSHKFGYFVLDDTIKELVAHLLEKLGDMNILNNENFLKLLGTTNLDHSY